MKFQTKRGATSASLLSQILQVSIAKHRRRKWQRNRTAGWCLDKNDRKSWEKHSKNHENMMKMMKNDGKMAHGLVRRQCLSFKKSFLGPF